MSNVIPTVTPTQAAPANPCRVRTPRFRVAFPHVFNAKKADPTQLDARTGQPRSPKYQVTMLFEKTQDLAVLRGAANAALVAKFGPQGPFPRDLTVPWKDGDLKDYQGFPGTIYVEASTTARPEIVDMHLQPIVNEDDFYSGCYAMASVTASYYEVMSPDGKSCLKKGIKFYLNNLLKVADGEGFVSRSSAADEFAGVPGVTPLPNTARGDFAGVAAGPATAMSTAGPLGAMPTAPAPAGASLSEPPF